MRIDLARQRDDTASDRVFDAIVQLVQNERGIQVLLDTLIQIRIHGSGTAFGAPGEHRNLVRDNFSAGEGLCNGFRLCLVAVGIDVPAQGYYALVAILIDGDLL